MTLTSLLTKLNDVVCARLVPLARQTCAVWQQRTLREQTLLRSGALLLGAVLLWVVALRPALQAVQTARQQLPVLQAQTARLGAIILEAEALTRGRSGTIPASDTEEALRTSLRASGLETVSVLSSSGGVVTKEAQWQVQFANAPAARIIEWLSDLPLVAQVQTRRVELVRSNVDGRDRPGQLSGVVVLALTPQGESS